MGRGGVGVDVCGGIQVHIKFCSATNNFEGCVMVVVNRFCGGGE